MGASAAPSFDAVNLIRKKRDAIALSDAEIDWLIESYVAGRVPDEQISALLMAVFFRGMSRSELAAWTGAMIASGERMDLSSLSLPTVDKHSTGGVGDKVSLILAPLVAACGAAVPQLSGRGLGHTGGTLDKLETIPGFRVELSPREMLRQLDEIGCVICAAGAGLAPADQKLYALRDVTATVESIPLIAASIISKKIAEGTESLVLDVKVGSGAFMTERERAAELAQMMVELGKEHGLSVVALLTAMDTPLGRCVGNALEVDESIEVLNGNGPSDLIEVTLALAREMLGLAGIGDADPKRAISDGSALEKFRRMVVAQGGDLDAKRARASHVEEVPAPETGYLVRLDARAVGVCSWRLGAGRSKKEDPVSASAGVVCLVKPGELVEEGQPILELHADSKERVPRARAALEGAIEIGDDPPRKGAAVLERIT